ncbi:M61 family metallopeptidase [Rhodohalobacter barkolensis]|uniref:Peptidase M61 n=1 Tax=Rhodohalobacter barkolensis TaxID=2053187 RepID=A0A2N0VI26_9BACT|nr:PDZ domain-containing protein [Rhodohalobacter barkolensis]PKD43856.1 peptidase M61 [Rhodohalobacter barkolensis]
MKRSILLFFITFLVHSVGFSQTTTQYEISFDNAVHHEAEISIHFQNLEEKELEVRMSRTSPGRYALHEFAKNVYAVKAFDGDGNELKITRPNPHQWNVSGHNGTVRFEYTLFANRGDGTYSQIDESHAHLNIPATFAWARNYEHRPIEVTFNVRDDLNWKVATQLRHLEENRYYAPDLDYFLDSPVEIADFFLRDENVDGQTIRMALHTHATEAEVDSYFEKVMAIVHKQRDVFGELPDFDYGEYTFLNCYSPNASGDGMEHRNSTVVSGTKPIDQPLEDYRISTISHEFFHIWNVERIRPASLEPFDFEEANMSGELWFAEGFTSYYTGLILARAGIITEEQYVEVLSGGINFVANSTGRNYFNPIEMSYQAPFVDAARSVDPTNRENTFISYYTYGSVLGLALDLSLRDLDGDLNLDDFMKQMWENYGRDEIPYTIRDIRAELSAYAGKEFSDDFFDNYIYNSKLPDYQRLFDSIGLTFEEANPGRAVLGTSISINNGIGRLQTNAIVGSPIYEAGINRNDEILEIGGALLSEVESVDEILSDYQPGDTISIRTVRTGEERIVDVELVADPSIRTSVNREAESRLAEKRSRWLKSM